MVVEFVTILLGVCAAAVALVLYAKPKVQPRTSLPGTSAPTKTYTPATERATPTKAAAAPAATAPAPSPAPATQTAQAQTNAPPIYESVQPTPAPAPVTAPASASVVTFGAASAPRRTQRTYRRRTAPTAHASKRAAPRRERKR